MCHLIFTQLVNARCLSITSRVCWQQEEDMIITTSTKASSTDLSSRYGVVNQLWDSSADGAVHLLKGPAHTLQHHCFGLTFFANHGHTSLPCCCIAHSNAEMFSKVLLEDFQNFYSYNLFFHILTTLPVIHPVQHCGKCSSTLHYQSCTQALDA